MLFGASTLDPNCPCKSRLPVHLSLMRSGAVLAIRAVFSLAYLQLRNLLGVQLGISPCSPSKPWLLQEESRKKAEREERGRPRGFACLFT